MNFSLSNLPAHLQTIKPYQPGRPIEDIAKEHGLVTSDIVKLASNENPLGTSPKAAEAIINAVSSMHLYPDGATIELRQKLGEVYGLDPDFFLPGNGSNELLELIGHTFIRPGDEVIFSQYAFIVYKLVSLLFGGKIVEVPATPGLGHDLNIMLAAITDKTKVIFLCLPNNPTGTMLSAAELDDFISKVPDHILIVLDAAYAEIVQGDMPEIQHYLNENRPVIICRTFSKAYGLAGLRIGYAIAQPTIINLLQTSRQPFNVNRIAQVAAIAALDDLGFVEEYKELCAQSKAYFEAFFAENSLEYVPSAANFILLKVGKDATKIVVSLEKNGMIVRPMLGYGLPDYIRISYGTMKQNKDFTHILSQILNI